MAFFGGKARPKEAFTREAVSLLDRMPGVRRVERVGELTLRVTVGGETSPHVVLLHNRFVELAGLPDEERRARLAFSLRALLDDSSRPQTMVDASGMLMPSLRTLSYLAASVGPVDGVAGPMRPPASAKVAPMLVEVVALDREHSMTFVSSEDLDRWQASWAEVVAVARDNLRAAGTPLTASTDVPGAFTVIGPDAYQSAWLLVPGAVDHMATAVGLTGSTILAFVPTRDDLLFLDGSDPALTAAALAWSLERFQHSTRSVSPAAYVVDSSGFAPWQPDRPHPCFPASERARRVLHLTEYTLQKNGLEQIFERSGEDIFVGSVGLGERPDASTFTWAAWVEAVDAGLVPEADLVGMVGRDGASFLVRWEDAQRVAGAWMERDPILDPPRWRVAGWPPGDVVEALRRLAVDP